MSQAKAMKRATAATSKETLFERDFEMIRMSALCQ